MKIALLVLFVSVTAAANYNLPIPSQKGAYIVSAWDAQQCRLVPGGHNFRCESSPGGNCKGMIEVTHVLLTRIRFEEGKKNPDQARQAIVNAFTKDSTQTITGYRSLEEFIQEANREWRTGDGNIDKDAQTRAALHPLQQAAMELQALHLTEATSSGNALMRGFQRLITPAQPPPEGQAKEMKARIDAGDPIRLGIQGKNGGHAIIVVAYELEPGKSVPTRFLVMDPNRTTRNPDRAEELKVLRLERVGNTVQWVFEPWSSTVTVEPFPESQAVRQAATRVFVPRRIEYGEALAARRRQLLLSLGSAARAALIAAIPGGGVCAAAIPHVLRGWHGLQGLIDGH